MKTSEPGFLRSTTILSWATRTTSSTPCCRTCSATCSKLRWAHCLLRVKRKSGKTQPLEARSLKWYIQITRTSICVVRITKTTYTLFRVWINCNHEKKKKRSWPVEFINLTFNKRRSLKRRKKLQHLTQITPVRTTTRPTQRTRRQNPVWRSRCWLTGRCQCILRPKQRRMMIITSLKAQGSP